ncbi:uncharacterized protein LOC129913752 isoform X3 [Episyrphus balteatus]|uniref:uncharacterized protein LOC129913752 isoform X3 n=1 Tax=Episyrphus balteatus TaxID=286459 RepID=UPI002485F896|nr:uncharacterized protein LOC129913752 isoform X3 [Episyrphus balteatus]
MLIFVAIFIIHACIAGTIPATPENITVTFLTPTTVRVSWQTNLHSEFVDKYIVTYKPTDDSYRVVQDVAGNSEAIILDRLSPSTQYSIAVTAIRLGKKYRSRQIIFRTLDSPKTSHQQDFNGAMPPNKALNPAIFMDDIISTSASNFTNSTTQRELPPIRGVEIGIVLIVLMVWAGAIALFFNRWGKIRMLLPYQPDYKHEQLKVPGTGVCAGGVCTGQHSHQNIHSDMLIQFDGVDCGALTYQPLHLNSRDEPSTSIAERCTRSRINSAIFVSSEGRGFDSIEFLRRHGSQSVLCRKARSAENITDNERKKSFSENRHWRTDEGEAQSSASGGKGGEAIELNDVGPAAAVVRNNSNGSGDGSNEITTQCTAMTCHSATAVTTANVIVGSISIETPPSHLKDDITVMKKQQSQEDSGTATESGEDFKQSVTTTATSTTTTIQQQRPRKLVHQRSSNASGNYSQSSPGGSPHHSTKNLSLKNVKQRIIALPMVSVSGPSPPHDKDYL